MLIVVMAMNGFCIAILGKAIMVPRSIFLGISVIAVVIVVLVVGGMMEMIAMIIIGAMVNPVVVVHKSKNIVYEIAVATVAVVVLRVMRIIVFHTVQLG